MTPEEEKKQPEPQNPPAGAGEANGAATSPELDAIKAQLEEERQAKTAAEATLAAKDARLAELETKLSEAQKLSEAAAAELAQARQAHGQAVAKYLDAVKLANPTIPGDVITGSTIEDIDASLQKATAIAGAVKATIEAQAKEARVPAGAPPRTEIPLEGLSPREKIAAGINKK
jgi:multidrug resistance efflux pump